MSKINNEDAELIARRILDQKGFQNYKIVENTYMENVTENDINIRTIIAEDGVKMVVLKINNDTGEFVNLSQSNNLVRSVSERIVVNETVVATTTSYFELLEPLSIPGIKTNSPNIEIVMLEDSSDSIKGFRVKMKDYDEAEIDSSYQEIRRLTNLLSIKTGRYIDHKRPEISIQKGEKTTHTKSFTIDAVLVRPVDLDLNSTNLLSILEDSDPLLTQQMADLVSGIKSFDDKNYKDAIKNFWLTLENENHQLQKNYKSLRDGLSHSEINNSDVINDLKNDFGLILKTKTDSIETPKGVYVDANNSINREIIKLEAKELREKAMNIIESKLQI